ncbi:uncharacterized protein N7469_000265 [Penicillium citrinum]|uniref:Uncharacterized protein n=1 Tax=Penicillium citrinum TaxID=5077 RepID=A0A9W9PCM3_PENCI|nr:uncharacterized protein N7469_000265 [Penicillium citrinum]KAJ5241938.1 hypothetical protein N7469_000265 [Penicillium citrinum]
MPIIPESSEFPSAPQKEDKGAPNKSGEQQKASAEQHLSKGPQIPNDMPPKASREEIEARMKELNKPAS